MTNGVDIVTPIATHQFTLPIGEFNASHPWSKIIPKGEELPVRLL